MHEEAHLTLFPRGGRHVFSMRFTLVKKRTAVAVFACSDGPFLDEMNRSSIKISDAIFAGVFDRFGGRH